jgi:hypothetical protein
MWVEVKELAPPDSIQLIGRANDDLRRRLAKTTGVADLDAWVTADYDDAAARLAIRMLKRELANIRPDRQLHIVIPAQGIGESSVAIEYKSKSGDSVRLVAAQSDNDHYPYLASADPTWQHEATVSVWNEPEKKLPAFKVLSSDRPAALILCVFPGKSGLTLRSVGVGEAMNVATISRMRERIEDAARQLKNAQRFRPKPGLAVIQNDSFGDHGELLRACLGNLEMWIDRKTNESGTQLGRDGVLNGGKNTSVSAVTYQSRLFGTHSLINPEAAFGIKSAWLPGDVYAVGSDSRVHLIRRNRR